MMLFKLMVAFSFLTITYGRSDEDLKSWFINLLLLCNIDHPVTSQELQMMQKHVLPPGNNAKCLVACVFRKINWLNGKGAFDVDQANALADKEYADDATKIENAKKLIDLCKKVNSNSVSDGQAGCDRSFFLGTCLLENAPQLGFTT